MVVLLIFLFLFGGIDWPNDEKSYSQREDPQEWNGLLLLESI